MRTIAIGDIHGCNTALGALIGALKPESDDTVITLGDYVDRGPDTKGVIGRLLLLRKHTNLISLLGNHEQMMLEARTANSSDQRLQDWLLEGGGATLKSYAHGGAVGFNNVPAEHWSFFESCREWYEDTRNIYVHANAYPDMDMEEQPDYMLLWEFLTEARQHKSGKTMICGHTAQKTGGILDLGAAICIDTHAYAKGWLTALETRTYAYWQANERGEIRTGHLER